MNDMNRFINSNLLLTTALWGIFAFSIPSASAQQATNPASDVASPASISSISTVSDWNEVAIRVVADLKKDLLTRHVGGSITIQHPFYKSHFENVLLEQMQSEAIKQGLKIQLNNVGAAVVRIRTIITAVDHKQTPAWDPQYDRLTLTVDAVFEGDLVSSTTHTYAILVDQLNTYQQPLPPSSRVIHLTNKATAP